MLLKDEIIETGHSLVELATHAADQSIAEARHLPQQNGRSQLDKPIGLRQRREHDVTLIHDVLRSVSP